MYNTGDRLTLTIDGTKYTGWKSAQVTRSIEAISGAFSLSVSDSWALSGEQRSIVPEMPCSVSYGADLLITGFVDNVDVSGSVSEHSITVKGRDKTGDLVDCSVIDCPAEFKNATLLSIIQKIAGPYGVKIAAGTVAADRINIFSIQPGERCFEAIDRACRAVGYFPTSNFLGEIVVARSGTSKISKPLVYGSNIKSYSGTFGVENRYKNYIVIAQQPGTDNTDGEAIAQVSAKSYDPNMMRNRTLKIIAEKSMNKTEAAVRANWEAAVRAGRSGTLDVSVQGWRDGDGNLWESNKLIDIYCPPVFGTEFYQEMLITSVSMALDDKTGTVAQLQLRRADSVMPEPLKAQNKNTDPWAALRADIGSSK